MEATITEPTAHRTEPSLDTIETTIDSGLPTCYNNLRFEQHREELAAAVELYGALDHICDRSRTFNLLECRKYAWFSRNSETGKIKVVANACRLRWCPVCAQAKQYHIRETVSEWLRGVTKPRFLTLTCSHSSDALAVQIDHLYKSFRLLRQHKAISRKIRGGIWFFQLKLSTRDHCWHPHLHILLDSNYIDQKELSLEWMRTTGNSYIVDIRAIKDPHKISDYVSRYCAKPCKLSDFDSDNRIEIATTLHGKRLCGGFGTGRRCSFKLQKPADASQWQKLGSWNHIVTDRFYNETFRHIVKCWSTGESIARELCETLIIANNPPELSADINHTSGSPETTLYRGFRIEVTKCGLRTPTSTP